MACFGCKCNLCARSCEIYSKYITIGEIDEVCFSCDDCKHWNNDYSKKSMWRLECPDFVEPEKLKQKRINKRRSEFQVISSFPKENIEE